MPAASRCCERQGGGFPEPAEEPSSVDTAISHMGTHFRLRPRNSKTRNSYYLSLQARSNFFMETDIPYCTSNSAPVKWEPGWNVREFSHVSTPQ